MRKGYRIVICVVGVWFALSVIAIGGHALKTSGLRQAYEQVKIGDSKSSVIAALGEPSQIDSCFGRGKEAAYSGCSETLLYSSFPYRWLFSVDTDGKVKAKFQQFRL